jgi:hypothetical protein
MPLLNKHNALSYALSLFVKKTFFSPHLTPKKSAYFFTAVDSIIPGLSLLLKISGLSKAPVARITFLALIFKSLCLTLLFLSFFSK